ncbi:hypothetical protein Pmani_005811 [Petrolisthes manimaculis]|uniref:Coiled-coil domain-containing protein 93 n=1 Tax=Petrolisthes manimaculis TaxID=1843537 RepID=A0AAE1UK69_9EUCA|nr:hypothetical protein Pmani_005811 [Petrolisthes manimaculis]
MISTETRPRSGSAREGQVDVREDEDQGLKLGEIVELLVAAGYFRARIKGLSPFDKVVGGMTWCIETCNFDLDVDLLFHENLTIGQKIALTEKIVRVVRLMSCPHRLEPHQIQGLDAIHIFPIIQWLVKKALETREEFGDETRQLSLLEYRRHTVDPRQERLLSSLPTATKALASIQSAYGPKRRWRRKAGATVGEPESVRVQTTLLEYGQQHYLGVAAEAKRGGQDETDGDRNEVAEVEKLMKTLDVAEVTEGRLSAQHVGSIVSSRVQEIAETSQHYSQLHQQITEEVLGDTASSQTRLLATLEAQRVALSSQLNTSKAEQAKVATRVEAAQARMKEVHEERLRLDQESSSLGVVDSPENKKILVQLSQLVEENEAAKKKEAEFKDTCRKESERMKKEISQLETHLAEAEATDEVSQRCAVEREKYARMRRQLAKKTRQVETLRRYIDDVPGRAELSQYQRRFIELYNQIAATHRETQQFYNMYNTLADTKSYMEKELSLLNSILDNMAMALGSSANMDEYLQQLETILEGIRQNKMKLERRGGEERLHRSSLSEELSRLQELNRQYARTVHALGQEITRNEMLQHKLLARTAQ